LLELLEEGRRLGFLGPGPLESHLRHAQGFAQAYGRQPSRVMDLGSGAGVPGLVLALVWPDARLGLVESMARRSEFLSDAVRRLGIVGQVEVLHQRAEEVGRDETYRSKAELVVARSFGPPAAVAECGAPLLSVEGRLVVSEPPTGSDLRWPEQALAQLGLRPLELAVLEAGRFQVLEQSQRCPERFPRRAGLPVKRPLF
jgi:16S rRNA (guanine527-N7)-methyltransferase